MAKKKVKEIIAHNIEETLDDIMSDRFGRYSKYIIQERALPDARDGLKPVQRRILYSMWVDGNTAEKPHRKSAKTVGSVMGTYHPHGDSSIYEAMVRMSQDWKINIPLIDMHGNNGSIDDDPPAAMRYTEARLSKNASLLLEDTRREIVPMTNNYDDTELEPTVLPARYPLLLVNGSTGIASGYATNIAPHNLNEVISAAIYRINNPDCTIDELMEIVKGPDFPTGGIVMGKDAIREVFRTGKGKVILRSKCEVVEGKTANSIIITEIPYEVVKSQLVKRISDLYLEKDLEGVLDVRDESGRNGLRIVVDLKKEANADVILNYLYKNTDLQTNYSYNCIAIVNHSPVLLSLAGFLDCFIDHRRQVVLNRSIYLRDSKKSRLHIIEGLIKAISILDSVIELIRKSKDKKESKRRLCEAFLFTEEQAEAIVNLRLYRLSNTDIAELKEEFANLTKEISELESIINSKAVLDNLLCKELRQINELCPIKRKTEIIDKVEEIVIDKMSMIPNEPCYITLSRDGYLKRFSPRAFNANENQFPYVKENDSLIGIKPCDTVDTLLVFTNKGNYGYIPVYRIDEAKFKDLGKHVSAYVRFDGNEKIVGGVVVKNFNSYVYVVTLSKGGMIKKTMLPRFNLQRYNKAVSAMKLKDNDEMAAIALCYEGDDLLVISRNGFYNRYSSSVLADLAPKAQGVGAISVKGDEAVALISFHHDGNELVLFSEAGNMKRIHLSDVPLTNRNAKGGRLYKAVKSNPQYVKYAFLSDSYSTLMFNVDGKVEMLDVKDIPFMSTEAAFSSPIKLSAGYNFIHQDHSDIPDALIVDIPEQLKENDGESYTETSLF